VSDLATTHRSPLWRTTLLWFGAVYLAVGAAAAAADLLHVPALLDRPFLVAAGAAIAFLGALAVALSRSLRAVAVTLLVTLLGITAGFALLGLSSLRSG
jgi:hypothetical protein